MSTNAILKLVSICALSAVVSSNLFEMAVQGRPPPTNPQKVGKCQSQVYDARVAHYFCENVRKQLAANRRSNLDDPAPKVYIYLVVYWILKFRQPNRVISA